MFLSNFFGWIVIVILLITFLLLLFWSLSNFNKKTRFTQIPQYVLKKFSEIVKINDEDIIYHLGCGDGRLLFYLENFNKKAKYVGVEDNKFFLLLIYLHNWWNKIIGQETIKIISKDFFEQNLSEATHVFTYLDPKIMDDLLPKLDKELKEGVSLISLNFKFTVKKPELEVNIKNKSYQPNQLFFIYKF